MTDHEIKMEREQAASEIKKTLTDLDNDVPGIKEGLAAALGAGTGAIGSFSALFLGGVTGLSAAGITSGLAAAGSLIGGGMAAGVGVLAAPIALLGIVGYSIAKKKKNAKIVAALTTAISKLYSIQDRLMKNAKFFEKEIAETKAVIEFLKQKKLNFNRT